MKKDKKCYNCSRMTVSQDEYISGMQDKIHDLEKEIEKMKCCGNCSKRNQCVMNVIDSLYCDKWEKEVWVRK